VFVRVLGLRRRIDYARLRVQKYMREGFGTIEFSDPCSCSPPIQLPGANSTIKKNNNNHRPRPTINTIWPSDPKEKPVFTRFLQEQS